MVGKINLQMFFAKVSNAIQHLQQPSTHQSQWELLVSIRKTGTLKPCRQKKLKDTECKTRVLNSECTVLFSYEVALRTTLTQHFPCNWSNSTLSAFLDLLLLILEAVLVLELKAAYDAADKTATTQDAASICTDTKEIPACHWESERWITSQITNPSTSRPWYHPSVKCFHKGCIANHFILKSYLSNNRYCQEKEKPIEPTTGRWWGETSAAPHVREESLSQWGSQTRTWIPSELHWSALELLSLLRRRGHSKEMLL